MNIPPRRPSRSNGNTARKSTRMPTRTPRTRSAEQTSRVSDTRERKNKSENSPHSEEEVRQVIIRSALVAGTVVAVLLLFGILMVYSATAPASISSTTSIGLTTFSVANMQLLYTFIGLVIVGVLGRIKFDVYRRYSGALAAFGIFFTALVVTPLGIEVGGNTNWISLGIISVQPSEFLKAAIIVYLAAFFARRDKTLVNIRKGLVARPALPEGSWWEKCKFRIGITDPTSFFGWAGLAALAGLVAILLGKDMGTALMYSLICAGVYFLAGLKPSRFLAVGVAGLAGVLGLIALNPSRATRVGDYLSTLFSISFTDKPTQTDYALWAFGSGGLSGTGLGTSAEKWPGNLPAAQTDYIFAIVGEELGFAGCVVVIVLFVILIWQLLRIAAWHPSRFGRYVCAGYAVWIGGQSLSNMLVATGVFPVFGVPLPFISQGGSSSLAALVGLGVVLSSIYAVPGVKESLHARTNIASRVRALVKK